MKTICGQQDSRHLNIMKYLPPQVKSSGHVADLKGNSLDVLCTLEVSLSLIFAELGGVKEFLHRPFNCP